MAFAPSQSSQSGVGSLLVTFKNIEDRYDIAHDVPVTFTLGEDVKASEWDWIGLMKTDWTDTRDYIAWEWAPSQPRDSRCPRDRAVTFPAKKLKNLNSRTCRYQFLYAIENRTVLGTSRTFSLCNDIRRDLQHEVTEADTTKDDETVEGPVSESKTLETLGFTTNVYEFHDSMTPCPPVPRKRTFDPVSLVRDPSFPVTYSRHVWENIVKTYKNSQEKAVVPYKPIYTMAPSENKSPDQANTQILSASTVTTSPTPTAKNTQKNEAIPLPYHSQSAIDDIVQAFNNAREASSKAKQCKEELEVLRLLEELPFAHDFEDENTSSVVEPNSENEATEKSEPVWKCMKFGHIASDTKGGVRSSSSYGPAIKCRPKNAQKSKTHTTCARSQEALEKELKDQLSVIRKRERGLAHVKKSCVDCKRRRALDTSADEQCKILVKEIEDLQEESNGLDEIVSNKNNVIHELSISLKNLIKENSVLTSEVEDLRRQLQVTKRSRNLTRELEKVNQSVKACRMTDEISDLHVAKMIMMEKNTQQQQEIRQLTQSKEETQKQLDDLLYTLSLKGYNTMVDANNNTVDLQGRQGRSVQLLGWDIVTTKRPSKMNDKLINQLRVLEEDNDRLAEENVSLRECNSELQLRNDEFRKQIDQLARDCDVERQNRDNYASELERTQEIVGDLREENLELQSTLCDTERNMGKVAEQEELIEQLRKEIERLKETSPGQDGSPMSIRQELEDVTKKLQEKATKLDTKTRKLVDKMKKLKQAKADLARSEALLQDLTDKERALTRILLRDRKQKVHMANRFREREEELQTRVKCLEHMMEANRLLQKSRQRSSSIHQSAAHTPWNIVSEDLHSTDSMSSALALLALSYADTLEAENDNFSETLMPRLTDPLKLRSRVTTQSMSALTDLSLPSPDAKTEKVEVNESDVLVELQTVFSSDLLKWGDNEPLDLSTRASSVREPQKDMDTNCVTQKRTYSEVVKGFRTHMPSNRSEDEIFETGVELIGEEPLSAWPELKKIYNVEEAATLKPIQETEDLDTGKSSYIPKLPGPIQTFPASCYCCPDSVTAFPQSCPYCLLDFPKHFDVATVQKHIQRHERLGS